MKVLITGATGFTGSHTVPVLLERGVEVRCFVRKTSDITGLGDGSVELSYGDLSDLTSLARALEGVDALVNVASIGFGHAPGIVRTLEQVGVNRAVFVSTTAIFTQIGAASKKIRIAAEKSIKESNLSYTIIRPTMIYGSSKDRNICRLIRFVNHYPAIPVFGDGNFLQQPIYVKDLAAAIVQALLADTTVRKEYNVAGAEPMTFNQLIDTIGELLGKKIKKIHLPAVAILKVLGFFENIGMRFPISSEQVMRLNEDKAFDYSDAEKDFGFSSIPFQQGAKLEIKEIFNHSARTI